MKLLGLIGGVSPESTGIYYRLLNAAAQERYGDNHSANLLIYTLDFGRMIAHYNKRDWAGFDREVANGAERLARAGADAIVITSNTTHRSADAAGAASGLPVIHMLDALSEAMTAAGVRAPLLMGTPVVMGEGVYRAELAKRYDGRTIVPDERDQETINRIILDELVNGEVREQSRTNMLEIVARGRANGADGIILGCTELCMILDQSHTDTPVFDTTAIHAAAAAAFAFEGD